jgi:hypothetical protein
MARIDALYFLVSLHLQKVIPAVTAIFCILIMRKKRMVFVQVSDVCINATVLVGCALFMARYIPSLTRISKRYTIIILAMTNIMIVFQRFICGK